jgi:predicted permease
MLDDVRYALRTWWRRPLFTAGVVVTLAAAVGSNVVVFGALYAVFLRPLPVADDDRLVVAYLSDRALQQEPTAVPYALFRDWQTHATTLSSVAAIGRYSLDLVGEGAARRVDVEVVSPEFFETLGVRPARGRTFSELRASDAGAAPCIISHALWQSRFRSRPDILGQAIRTADSAFVVTAVMPAGFERWRGRAEMWLPIDSIPAFATVKSSPGYRQYHVVGRLRDGAAAADASSELERIAARFMETTGDTGERTGAAVRPLRLDVVGISSRRTLVLLAGIAILVWIAASANIASLLVAGCVDRAGELDVRLALGATRARLIRQLLTESSMLIAAGCAVGLAVAYAGLDLLRLYGPPAFVRATADLPRAATAAIAVAATMLTALAVGLWPAWNGSPRGGASIASGRHSASKPAMRLQDGFVAAQIAIAVVVLAATMSMTRTFLSLRRVDVGFSTDAVLTARVSLPPTYFGRESAMTLAHAAQAAIVARLEAVPGIAAAAIGQDLPVPSDSHPSSITIEHGRRFLNGNVKDRPFTPGRHVVSAGYFGVLGVRVVSGRDFNADDTAAAVPVAIVTETMARMHWPNQDPIGRRVTFGRVQAGRSTEPWLTIVGVVADVRYGGPRSPIKGEIYLPAAQEPVREFWVAARTVGEPLAAAAALQRTISSIEPDIPVFDVRTLDDRLADTTSEERAQASLSTLLAALALMLSTTGAYAGAVRRAAQRRKELAIRVALGATPHAVVRLVLVRLAAIAGASAAAGLLLAVAASRWLANHAGAAQAADGWALAGATGSLAALVAIAAWLPARRAARADPLAVLRAE